MYMYMYMYGHAQPRELWFIDFNHVHVLHIHCIFPCYGIGEGQWRGSEADQTGGGQSPEGEE